MFEFLFIDMDDTVLDFKKAEHVAIRKTLEEAGIPPTDAVCQRYSQINQSYWERLERKEVTREQLQVGRFADLMAEFGAQGDPQWCARRYMENLGKGHYFMPGAEEALQQLFPKYKLYLASNGNTQTQFSRIESAGIAKYFQEIFVSGVIGINKPDKAFFDYCFARIPGFAPEKTMIVGDSLTSDILGGKNAGITTCWVNPAHKPCRVDIVPDYQIESLTQLSALLETL
jgi:2-haloacid dehalogenase